MQSDVHDEKPSELKRFLTREGLAATSDGAPKWVGEALCGLLRTKRGDDLFWTELKELTCRLGGDAARAGSLRGIEALTPPVVYGLMDQLRSEVDGKKVHSTASPAALIALRYLDAALGS